MFAAFRPNAGISPANNAASGSTQATLDRSKRSRLGDNQTWGRQKRQWQQPNQTWTKWEADN